MFKKISLLAAGAAAEYDGTSKDIALCTAQATTVTNYIAGVNCVLATIKLEGGDPPADNEATDGYKATMTVGFAGVFATNTDNQWYGICVIPVATTGTDDTAYMKAPRGMCLGKTTANVSNIAAPAAAADLAVGESTGGNVGKTGAIFCHNSFTNIVTNSAAKSTTDWVETGLVISQILTQAGVTGQTAAALTPTGCTSMAAMITYGVITVPNAAFYLDTCTATDMFAAAAAKVSAMALATPDAVATFWMPTEAETYADVPRLSPLDSMGWQAYAPDVVSFVAGDMGRNIAQLTVSNTSIVDNFATTVAAGVAIVGAAALSF